MRELVSLGGADSIAQDINDGGFVVGRADLAQGAGFRAALWRPDRAVVNLDAWLDAADPQLGAHWLLSHAHGISDNGWITGIGIYNDGPGGLQDGDLTYLLDASALVPEPGGAAILGACALTTLRRRRPAEQIEPQPEELDVIDHPAR
jgi:MYXO-CTERM domain-containing protein